MLHIYVGHCLICKRGWTFEDQKSLENAALKHGGDALLASAGRHNIVTWEWLMDLGTGHQTLIAQETIGARPS